MFLYNCILILVVFTTLKQSRKPLNEVTHRNKHTHIYEIWLLNPEPSVPFAAPLWCPQTHLESDISRSQRLNMVWNEMLRFQGSEYKTQYCASVSPWKHSRSPRPSSVAGPCDHTQYMHNTFPLLCRKKIHMKWLWARFRIYTSKVHVFSLDL